MDTMGSSRQDLKAETSRLRVGVARAALIALLTLVVAVVAVLAIGDSISADGTCATHYPYKVYDGHGHDGDGDGVGCEWNPGPSGTTGNSGGSSSGSSSSTYSLNRYDRDDWNYKSGAARSRLGCSSSEHVDHIVALKEAHDSNGNAWSSSKKEQFANDPLNQWCLDAGLNMSKSDGDLAEWSGGSCAQRKLIAERTIAVKAKYGLSTDSAESQANQAALARDCNPTPSTSSTSVNAATSAAGAIGTTASSESVGTSGTGAASSGATSTSDSNATSNADRVTEMSLSVSLTVARYPLLSRAVVVTIGSDELAGRGVTASALLKSLAERGVIGLWKWTSAGWLLYAEVDGFVIPGSTDFDVAADDSLLITLS